MFSALFKKVIETRSKKDDRDQPAQSPWVVLCDFDGTISRRDVGNSMFAKFASCGWEDVVQSWKKGQIGSRDCLVAECSLTRATRDQVASFALTQEIDPHFKRFLHFCRSHDIPVVILSDGLDFYIDLILKKHGLEDLPLFANQLTFRGSKMIPSFPYFHKGCGSCGNCKGFHVLRYKQNDSKVIYIGDGFSDRCGVKDADVVFAKRDLRRYCRQHGIGHISYRDFGDVLRQMQSLIDTEFEPRKRGSSIQRRNR